MKKFFNSALIIVILLNGYSIIVADDFGKIQQLGINLIDVDASANLTNASESYKIEKFDFLLKSQEYLNKDNSSPNKDTNISMYTYIDGRYSEQYSIASFKGYKPVDDKTVCIGYPDGSNRCFESKNDDILWSETENSIEIKVSSVDGTQIDLTFKIGALMNKAIVNDPPYDNNGIVDIHFNQHTISGGTARLNGTDLGAYSPGIFTEIVLRMEGSTVQDKDSDKDGVIDLLDSCPKTPVNSCVDDKGCSCELSIIDENGRVEKNKWKTYYTKIDSQYSQFSVKIQNLTEDVDLYVKKGSKPDLNNYDCRPYKGGKRDEVCDLSNSGENLWYFSVYGYKSGNFTISVKAKR